MRSSLRPATGLHCRLPDTDAGTSEDVRMNIDTFNHDIANNLDALLYQPVVGSDGSRTWERLFFASPKGFRPLVADLAVPHGPGPHPLVVFVHGGAWWIGNPYTTNPVLEAMNIRAQFLKAGFAFARISYRLSGEGCFPTQLHDCKAAVRYFRKHAEILGIDANRFAAMGESAGGHLAIMLGLTGNRTDLEGSVGVSGASSAVQAVVDWYGPTDFLTMDAQRPSHAVQVHDDAESPESHLIGGALPENRAAAAAASPISYVTSSAPPFLIQHGDQDRLVPVGQGRALAQRLQDVGVSVVLSEIEGADHCFWGVDTTDIVPEAVKFLRNVLQRTSP
jgi:acetyl esterase/lipase